MNMKSNRPLIIAIVVAAAAIVAAMGYFTRQLASRPDEARVVALINEHLNAQSKEGQPAEQQAALTEKDVIALIDQRLGQQKGAALSEKEFNARVERGIVAYVEKQRQEAQDRPNRLARNVPPPGKSDHVYGKASA